MTPQASFSAPSITTFTPPSTLNGELHIAWRGTDNRLNIENLDTQDMVTLPDTTSAAPALACYNFSLALAWTGTDPQHHLNVALSNDGKSFKDKVTLAQTTPAANGPALAGL